MSMKEMWKSRRSVLAEKHYLSLETNELTLKTIYVFKDKCIVFKNTHAYSSLTLYMMSSGGKVQYRKPSTLFTDSDIVLRGYTCATRSIRNKLSLHIVILATLRA